MDDMKRRFWLIGLILGCALSVCAQQSTSDILLLRTNNLRGSLGLHTYRWNEQLRAAAQTHANWLANTSRDCSRSQCHRDDSGRFARDRARIAGYPGERVHENYYRGGDPSADSAWNFWIGSPAHYGNLTSPNNSDIGIAVASAGGRYAFVAVFGHAGGAPAASGQAGSGDGAAPAYVLGLDEFGNIKHEVLPGHTIGDIALFYGYTWEDIPVMLELNGMTSDDIRALQPGSVFLVPPKAGTFTPTSTLPQPVVSARSSPTARPTNTPPAPTMTPSSTQAATPRFRIGAIATQPSGTVASMNRNNRGADPPRAELALLGAAILLQLGLLAGAAIALIRRLL